uniref:SH3 domain-containing protein n=1 Tax=Trichobilharzia regenti TaxID=157069 RepID=A0AA85JTZ3_TRIRE|nr:unnamed protein product [Trichobilharzia regenti]
MTNRDIITEDATFKANHIASFIEGDVKLTPKGVVHHINKIHESDRIEETPCIVKLDKKGIQVELISTGEVVEFFEWPSISDEIAMLKRSESFNYGYLILFRCSQYNAELRRDESELHVFSCETQEDSKLLVDSIHHHICASLKQNLNGGTAKNSEITLRRGRSEEKIVPTNLKSGRNFYMLNKCIDDIESFEKRLEKGIKRMSNNERNNSGDGKMNGTGLPSKHDAQETIRKVKYAFNINEQVRPLTPGDTAKKIFIRLFNTVHWLDKVCSQNLVADYDQNMVRDVVEPLLEESTLSAIMTRLQPKQQDFWRELGPAWNTPPSRWTENISRYSPQFTPSGTNKRQTWPSEPEPVTPGVVDIEVKVNDQTHTCSPRQSPVPAVRNKTPSPVRFAEKPTELRAKSWDTRSHPQRPSNGEQKWCVVNVHHVSAKPQELSVQPGDVLSVLIGNRGDWWTVQNDAGESGQVPAWKLKPYNYRPDNPPVAGLRKTSSMTNLMSKKSTENVNGNNENGHIDNNINNSSSQLQVNSSLSPRSLSRDKSPPRQQLDTTSVNINICTSPTGQNLNNDKRNNNDSTDANNNNFMYIAPSQLQEAIKINTNVPMLLIPVTNLYNNGNPDMSLINWSALMNPNTNGAELARVPNPGVLGPGWKPAPILTEALGYSPYPFNYPTHMHTMTRELRERLSKMQLGGGSGLKSVPIPTTTLDKPDQRLSKFASQEEVAEWLVAHQFSPKTISALKGFNGMDLYTMNRTQLEEHVGPERCDELFYAFRGT